MKLVDNAPVILKIQCSLNKYYRYCVRKPTIPVTNSFFVPSQFDQNQQIRVLCG